VIREVIAAYTNFFIGHFCVAALAGAVVLRKTSDIPLALIWLALRIAPLVVRRLLAEEFVSAPLLFVAGVTAMAYLYGEIYLSNEPYKVAAKTVMATAAQHAPLYQFRTPLNNGALSFYAGRVVPPVDATEIGLLLQENSESWLIGAGAADLADRRRRAHGRPGELEAGPVTLMREPLWKPHHVVGRRVHGNDQLASRGHFPGCVDELSHMGPRVAVLVDDLAGSVAEAEEVSVEASRDSERVTWGCVSTGATTSGLYGLCSSNHFAR